MEGLYLCIGAVEGNADKINAPAKATFLKIEAGHLIFRIREIEVEKGVNLWESNLAMVFD